MSTTVSVVSEIEDAFEGDWRRFGLYPGAELFDEDGVLWFESEIAHLPYNAAGAAKVVLHASGMAKGMYRKMGFTERRELLVYATHPVFGTHHH